MSSDKLNPVETLGGGDIVVTKPKPVDERDLGLFDNCVKLLLSRTGAFGFSILTSVLIARTIGPEGRGWLAVFRAYPEMIAVILLFGMRQSAVFYLAKDDNPSSIINNLVGFFSIVGTAGVLISVGVLLVLFPENANLCFLAGPIVAITIATNLIQAILISSKRLTTYSRINAYRPIINLALVIALFATLGVTVDAILVASLVAGLLVIAGSLSVLRRDYSFALAYDWQVYGKLIRFGVAAWFAIILFKLLERVDALTLSFAIPVGDLGQLTLAQNNARFFTTMAAAFGPAVWSKSANSDGGVTKHVYDTLRLTIWGTLLLGGFCGLIAPWVIPLVYGSDFSAAGVIFPLLIPGVIGMTMLNIANFDIAGKGTPLMFWKPILLVVVVKAGFNFALASRLGIYQIAIGTSLAYAAVGFLALRIHLKHHNSHFRDVVRMTPEDWSMLKTNGARLVRSLPIVGRGRKS